jgi:hypothetical protein
MYFPRKWEFGSASLRLWNFIRALNPHPNVPRDTPLTAPVILILIKTFPTPNQTTEKVVYILLLYEKGNREGFARNGDTIYIYIYR